MTKQRTLSIDERETAWFQLLSAAGTFLDRFHGGTVTETNREDVWVLRECVNRVIKVEGMRERPDTGEYEVVVLPEEREAP
ncbi:MAG: hypothetical protein RBU30_25525 [Polyangia bacterium]|jgi:hypothetical protein|nr:hypothetical protein [Polyangia bacterium]